MTKADIINLMALLKSEHPSRGGTFSDEMSWSAGSYAHGALVGLRKNVAAFPEVCRLICRYIRQSVPGHPFTTFMLGKNLMAGVHVDKNNERGLPNAILKISTFSQGGIWVECDTGPHTCPAPGRADLKGNILDFVNDRIILGPTKRHCQAPWSGGDRIVLVAFVAKFHERLVPEDRKRLEDLGFSLPIVGAFHDARETTSPTGPEVGTSPVRVLCGSSPLSPRADRKFKCVVGIPWSPRGIYREGSVGGPSHTLAQRVTCPNEGNP